MFTEPVVKLKQLSAIWVRVKGLTPEDCKHITLRFWGHVNVGFLSLDAGIVSCGGSTHDF